MKRWIYVGAAVLIVAALIGWRLTQKRAEAADQAKQRQARGQSAIVVQVAAAKRQDVVKRFEAGRVGRGAVRG
jgi:membrane protein implicated in regulation of membrane protease activity